MNAERPTPETDALLKEVVGWFPAILHERMEEMERQRDVARENTKAWHGEYRALNDLHRELGLEHKKALRQLDEAVQIAKKYENRYLTMSELRNNDSIVALQYKAQRDRLLEALRVVLEDWKAGYRPEESGKSLDVACAAIAEVEGGR